MEFNNKLFEQRYNKLQGYLNNIQEKVYWYKIDIHTGNFIYKQILKCMASTLEINAEMSQLKRV